MTSVMSRILHREHDVVDEYYDEESEDYIEVEETCCWSTEANVDPPLYICHHGLMRYFDIPEHVDRIRIEVSDKYMANSYRIHVVPREMEGMDTKIYLDNSTEWVDSDLAKFLEDYLYARVLTEW